MTDPNHVARVRIISPDGEEGYVTAVTLRDAHSFSVWFDQDGNVCAEENGERVDALRAVEIYGLFGGAIGWRLMDAIRES